MKKPQKLLACILSAAVLICSSKAYITNTQTISTESKVSSSMPVWDGTIDKNWEGAGTKKSPYKIYTPEQFAGMVVGDSQYKGAFFELMNDIDLGGKPKNADNPAGEWIGKNWASLDKSPFYGEFDGNDHVITGYYAKKISGGSNYWNSLFPTVSGSIKNITVYGRSEVDGAIAESLNGTISNCVSYVDCYGTKGGMLGEINGNSVIENCYNYGEINTSSNSAGIVGDVTWGDVTIRNCANFGDINNIGSDAMFTGGVAAYVPYSSTSSANPSLILENCENFGDIYAPQNYHVGGLVGYVDAPCEIRRCANFADITGYNHASGIADSHSSKDFLVENCFNKGRITCKKSGSYVYGITNYSSRTTCCYAISELIADDTTGIGGNYCYYVGNADIDEGSRNNLYEYIKKWDNYVDGAVTDINGEFNYFEVNALSNCQNGFPVLSWEADRFKIGELKQTDGTQTTIDLQWPLVTRATGYEVYRCDTQNGALEKIAITTEPSYQDSGLTADKKYYYKVRSYLSENDYTFYGEYSNQLTASTEAVPVPSIQPTVTPTAEPTIKPTVTPTAKPTVKPTVTPTVKPTAKPTAEPTAKPTVTPTAKPTVKPTVTPTVEPTVKPTAKPTAEPTAKPTVTPTAKPTVKPTTIPTAKPEDLNKKVVWNGTVDKNWEGAGTKKSPYKIYTPEQFAGMVIGDSQYQGAFFELMNDIDLGGKPKNADNPAGEWTGRNWADLDKASFRGEFDGKDHMITGFYAKEKTNSTFSSTATLFGSASGSIKNITIYGRSEGNGAIAESFSGTMSNCISYVDCYGAKGGMLAEITGDTLIENCYNFGEINTSSYSAGIAGWIRWGNVTIRNCANFGDINNIGSDAVFTGGIAAYVPYISTSSANPSLILENCENFGDIYAPQNYHVGGLVGYVDAPCEIRRCANFGELTGYDHAAGIADVHNSRTFTIEDCFNKGNISCGKYNSYVYGIGGYPPHTAKCYAISELKGTRTTGIWGNHCYYVGNSEIDSGEYSQKWNTYEEGAIDNINGEFNYFEINDLSNCQNGFPVLAWETDRFKISHLTQKSSTYTTIDIKWPLVSRATGYEIYRCDSRNGEMQKIAETKEFCYNDSGLNPDSQYYYQVRSYLTENGHTFYGEFSSILAASTKSMPPLGDINQDGCIDLYDVQLALKSALNIIQLDEMQKLAADIDGNGRISLTDAQSILKAVLKIIEL